MQKGAADRRLSLRERERERDRKGQWSRALGLGFGVEGSLFHYSVLVGWRGLLLGGEH